MWRSLSILPPASILLSSLALFSCSSGGGDSSTAIPTYSGTTLPAAITSANAEDVGRGATEAVNEAVNLMSTGEGIPFVPIAVETGSSSTMAQKLKQIATEVLQASTPLDLPAGAVFTADQLNAQTGTGQFCGGSVIMPDNIDPNSTLNFTMTFSGLCYDDGIMPMIMNGILTFTQTETAFSIGFTNFSVVIDGKQESFTGAFSCDASLFTSTISTDYAGSDGKIYRLENVDINGDDFVGYTVSADFYHHDFGMVSITTSVAVSYGSCGIYPEGGEITMTGTGDSSLLVTFNSNCTFTVQGFDSGSAFGPDSMAWL